ncbi:6-phosphogluconolactonase [Nocardioides acrostichi]|uniref:6-phosphogluconolactonase n=1 Tax=Nocardioides acrostichi TaxID=2784339 RepID=A0A930UWA7_9ACTN|nr:6-phosphogluconolactonase [Nocardioides acrostichi]MBF4162043.1 6-phosphogluconolactonase [Nocardioides acrostichi]
MTRPEPRVEVHPDADTLATTVAGALLERLVEAQAAGREPNLGLTGGTIAEAIHREVARLGPASGVDWSRVVIWWGDERFVEAGSPERNAAQARAAFIDPLGIPRHRVHEVASSGECPTAEEAADIYSAAIREHGAGEFEVLMFGLGPDGHLASLFPGHAGLRATDRIAIAVHDSPKPPPERVSLTYEAFDRSRAVWFLVSGEGKADAVARTLGADATDGDLATRRETTPAVGVHGVQETVWFLDRAAASRL